MPDRMGKTRSECFRGGTFFILTFFKLILKLTSGKHYLHPVTPWSCLAAWRGRPPLPRHMQRRGRGATLASRGAWGRRGHGLAAPHAPARQACRTTPHGAAAASIQARPGPLSSSSSLSSSPRAHLHQPPQLSAGIPPNPAICGGDSMGNRSPYPWEGIALI
jgi:hypothetical protein